MKKFLTLLEKRKLTHDVFELIFVSEWEFDIKAWQVVKKDGHHLFFIIKRVDAWKWWSKFICDMQDWTSLEFIWPIWNFVLKTIDSKKLFIGTWTWFAPLFFQLTESLAYSNWNLIRLVFWLRRKEDIFYLDELDSLKNIYPNFDYIIYLSREDRFVYRKWYVTDYLNKDTVSQFDEFYMCWSPQVIVDIKTRLESFRIDNDRIFFEQY